MKPRPDLLRGGSPQGIEVFQLTTEDIPSSHVYMEAQIFAPDSKRFLLHRSAHAHGSDLHDPEHRYLVCELEEGGALRPLTHETGATAPSVTSDGQWVYYFVNETELNGGRLTLKRVRWDGAERQTIMVVDAPLPGTSYRPSRIYPLSTISSDGQRIALAAFMGNGQQDDAPFGLMVFDIRKAEVRVILEGQTWCNLHPQYTRSRDPERCHDIMVQENHGNHHDAQGRITVLVSGDGADIHVIRDDGTDFRDIPWGRDGNESCQGHQCWRGRSDWMITSTHLREPRQAELIEAQAVPHVGHIGLLHPQGRRNDLTRHFARPDFDHFATDIEARRFVTDAVRTIPGGGLYTAKLGQPGADPLTGWTFLLSPGSTLTKQTHIHPFLSPDGKLAFFNSDESGVAQAYMVRGLENL
ncbi:MAG: hypothetical protein GXY76_12740 [Chloroflexi bacterium]|nr:hypothetical protein [Chloroflexota bacterium]